MVLIHIMKTWEQDIKMNIFCNYKNFLDRKLLRMKHREQLAAVQNIVNIGDKKKQKKLLDELLASMEKVYRRL